MNQKIFIGLMAALVLSGCTDKSQEVLDRQVVERQQEQYAKGQPIPTYDFSLERHLVIQLYDIRNSRVATHSVWRGDFGVIEGDCPSMGYGLPYDTSLTNPLMATDEDLDGIDKGSLTSIGQAEPNGVFASTNTSATWVMCTGETGLIEPIYIEAKVTVYPYPLAVDYETNRVEKAGESAVTINMAEAYPK